MNYKIEILTHNLSDTFVKIYNSINIRDTICYIDSIEDIVIDLFVEVQKEYHNANPNVVYSNGKKAYCSSLPEEDHEISSIFNKYVQDIRDEKQEEYTNKRHKFAAFVDAATLIGAPVPYIILRYALKHIVSVNTYIPDGVNKVSIAKYNEKLADIYNYMFLLRDFLNLELSNNKEEE